MKKLLILLFLAVSLLETALLVGCDSESITASPDSTTAQGSQDTTQAQDHTTTQSPPESVTESTTTETTAPDSTENTDGLAIPEDYYTDLNFSYNCSSIVIPAEYNEGIAYDIYPVVKDGIVYFLLPSSAELSQVVYHMYDNQGEFLRGRVADFTSQSLLGKKVQIFYEPYDVVAYRSDSPTLYIEIDETYGTFEEMQDDRTKETKAYGTMLLECREDIAEKYGWSTSYESRENDSDSPCTMYVKGRGNWSWLSADKQGYSIKLEVKDDLLGMSKSKKWALIGNQPDNTMLRNPLAYYLGDAAGFDYTPSGEIVDLFVNGEYMGAFLLSEKVDINEERVNINDLEKEIEALSPEQDYGRQMNRYLRKEGFSLKYWSNVPNPGDITGGYIIEMEMADRYRNEPSGFSTRQGFYYVIKSPEYVSYEQAYYIASLVQELEDALYADDGINPTTGKSYLDYMDLDSFVKKYWVDEISKNRDGAKTSHYLYKPADSQSEKLFAGPLWDYDIAFGISAETVDPEGWFSRTEKAFYEACFDHGEFEERAKELYFEIFYPTVIQFIKTDADSMAEKIAASMEMNYVVWDQLDKEYMAYVEDLKSYLEKRIKWIYTEIS